MALLMSLCAVLFPTRCLDGIWDLVGSVSEVFLPTFFIENTGPVYLFHWTSNSYIKRKFKFIIILTIAIKT